MTRTAASRLLAAGAVVLAAAASATAQTAPSPAPAAPAAPVPGLSPNQPMDISADTLDRFQNEGRIVYKGQVEAVQGATRLSTPQLTIFTAPAAGRAANGQADLGSVQRIEAEGPVYYVTPTQQAKGDHGTYLAAPDTITLVGNVTLVQGQDVLHGDKLVIEQKTGHSILSSNTPGKGANRVRGVFFPQNGTGASSGGGAPKPQGG